MQNTSQDVGTETEGGENDDRIMSTLATRMLAICSGTAVNQTSIDLCVNEQMDLERGNKGIYATIHYKSWLEKKKRDEAYIAANQISVYLFT